MITLYAMSICATRPYQTGEGEHRIEAGNTVAYGYAEAPWQVEAEACMYIVPDIFPLSEGWDYTDFEISEIDLEAAKKRGYVRLVSCMYGNPEQGELAHFLLIFYGNPARNSIDRGIDESARHHDIVPAKGWVGPKVCLMDVKREYIFEEMGKAISLWGEGQE